jgi:hypothetical protein
VPPACSFCDPLLDILLLPPLHHDDPSLNGSIVGLQPLEMGFILGFACTNGLGTCTAGMDIETCAQMLTYQCGGSANVKWSVLPTDISCGGHATPFHYHTQFESCEYEVTIAH